MTRVIIFGTGKFAEIVHYYLNEDRDYKVVAFTESSPKKRKFLGLNIIDFSQIIKKESCDFDEIFVAIGYAQMNQVRSKICKEIIKNNIKLLTYVSKKALISKNVVLGKNVFIFEKNNIQPYVTIGNGSILWSGNHVGHHSKIGEYCFITSHVVISGNCTVGSNSFLGVNSSISDSTNIAEKNLIGASCHINSDTKKSDVFINKSAINIKKKSNEFFN